MYTWYGNPLSALISDLTIIFSLVFIIYCVHSKRGYLFHKIDEKK